MNRNHHLDSTIKITWKGKVFLTDEATALARGPYIIEGTTENYREDISFMLEIDNYTL